MFEFADSKVFFILTKVADISNYTITKMSKGENVTVETLGKICAALNCGVDDIMEFVSEENW